VKQIREQDPISVPAAAEGFRIGCVPTSLKMRCDLTPFSVTEQPYKIPFYAALLRLLYDPAEENATVENPSLGKQILEDFWKGFQAFLDKLAWREMRLCVSNAFSSLEPISSSSSWQIHLFAHLTVAEVVSAESLSSLLKSFTAVLDEPGVSHGRAKRAALCAAEGLIIVCHFVYLCRQKLILFVQGGHVMKATDPTSVVEIINAIHGYSETLSTAKWLVHPYFQTFSDSINPKYADEVFPASQPCSVT
jgi:nuclear cap-binding protein subunit 1